MTRTFSKCSDIKMYPDVTLMFILSMPLSAFGFNFVQINGHALSQGEIITTLKSYVLIFFFRWAIYTHACDYRSNSLTFLQSPPKDGTEDILLACNENCSSWYLLMFLFNFIHCDLFLNIRKLIKIIFNTSGEKWMVILWCPDRTICKNVTAC